MISEQQRADIRRLFFAEHGNVGTIATELGIHHDAVELALEPKRFVNRRFADAAGALDAYKRLITDTLTQYPRLRATRLLEMIAGRGYRGQRRPCVATCVKYARCRSTGILPVVGAAGRTSQVDWGSFESCEWARASACCRVS